MPFSQLIQSVLSAEAKTPSKEGVSLGGTGTQPFTQSTCDATADVKPSDSYKPAVGDVVEFEYNGKQVGIIYRSDTFPDELALTCHDLSQFCYFSYYKNHRKISHTDTMPHKELAFAEARDITKAYFSKPTFKVGDKVKLIGPAKVGGDRLVWLRGMKDYIGKTLTLSSIFPDSVGFEGVCFIFPCCELELVTTPTFTGTYEERQRQWIEYHGLEVGSKVKVVRKFESDEDGYNGTGRDSTGQLGKILIIQGQDGIRIAAALGNWFPYFALEPA